MKPFTESLRHEYKLTPESVAVDLGAFHGGWAKTIHEKYRCPVLAFEPVKSFFAIASENCAMFPKIALYNCGLGDHFYQPEFGIQNDSTGIFAGSEVREKVIIVEAVSYLRQIHPKGFFDLIKINIEGGEADLLDHVLSQNAATMFGNIQVQWHRCIPDCQKRYDAVAAGLSKTHHLTWCEPWCWESWEMNA